MKLPESPVLNRPCDTTGLCGFLAHRDLLSPVFCQCKHILQEAFSASQGAKKKWATEGEIELKHSFFCALTVELCSLASQKRYL